MVYSSLQIASFDLRKIYTVADCEKKWSQNEIEWREKQQELIAIFPGSFFN